VSYGLTFPWR